MLGVLFVLAKSQPVRQAGRHPAHHPPDDVRDEKMRGILSKPLVAKMGLLFMFEGIVNSFIEWLVSTSGPRRFCLDPDCKRPGPAARI